MSLENTCVTLDCPFIWYCKEYNFLVDRGQHCEHQDQILLQAKRLMKQRRIQKENASAKTTTHPAE